MALLPKEKLIDLLKQKKVIPFVGAGFSSATAKVPGWASLIKNGLEYARVRNLDKNNLIEKSEQELAKNNLLTAANFMKEVLNAPSFAFSNWIKEEFQDLKIVSSDLINSILDLNQDVIFTTNYDTLLTSYNNLDNKQLFIHNEYELALNSLKAKNEIVMHLHGVFSRPDSIILSKNDYDLINKNDGYKSFIQKMLSDYHFLFIGCSKDGIMDEDFLIVFNFIKEWFSNSSNQHFILLHEKEVKNQNHIQLLTECNIEAIVYGNEYDQLSPFINTINPNYAERQGKISKYREKLDSEFKRLAINTENFKTGTSSLESFLSTNLNSKYDWVDSEKMKIFENILSEYNNSILDKKERLKFSQTIIQSVFNTIELKEKIDLWSKYGDAPEKLNPLNYISTALLAYDCLLKIPQELIDDIRLSNHSNVFHYGFYHGNLGNFVKEINAFKKEGLNLEEIYRDDRYLFENLKRIIQSLKNFLELDAESFYVEVENATINENIPKKNIIIVSDTEITIRSAENLLNIFARLPLDSKFPVTMVECLKIDSNMLIIGSNSNACFSWNPTEDIYSSIIYKFSNTGAKNFKNNKNHLYVQDDNKISILNNSFTNINEIKIEESFSTFTFHSTGIVCLKKGDSTYKGDILLWHDFNGKLIQKLSYNYFINNIEKDEKLIGKILEGEIEDPLSNFFSKLIVKSLNTITYNNKEYLLLNSRLKLNFDEESSLIFLLEITNNSIVIIKKIHLNNLCCSCSDFIVNSNNQLQLVFGYYDIGNNPIMCEEYIIDINFNIKSRNTYEYLTPKAEYLRDIFSCKYLDEENLVLSEEGKKLILLSTKTKKINEYNLYDDERINYIATYA